MPCKFFREDIELARTCRGLTKPTRRGNFNPQARGQRRNFQQVVRVPYEAVSAVRGRRNINFINLSKSFNTRITYLHQWRRGEDLSQARILVEAFTQKQLDETARGLRRASERAMSEGCKGRLTRQQVKDVEISAELMSAVAFFERCHQALNISVVHDLMDPSVGTLVVAGPTDEASWAVRSLRGSFRPREASMTVEGPACRLVGRLGANIWEVRQRFEVEVTVEGNVATVTGRSGRVAAAVDFYYALLDARARRRPGFDFDTYSTDAYSNDDWLCS